MDSYKKPFCRLCLNSTENQSLEKIDNAIKTILEIARFKLNSDDRQEQLMCSNCSQKLNAACEFKATCLSNNDTIISYTDFNPMPMDLREIYMKENGVIVLDDQKICRLCMQPVRVEFVSVREMEDDIFQRYIPEVASVQSLSNVNVMNFNVTRDPHICRLCADTLTAHNAFMKNCLGIERVVVKKSDEEITASPPDVQHLDMLIKYEAIEEEEENESKIKTEINFTGIEEISNQEVSIKKEDECGIKLECIKEEGLHSSHQLNDEFKSRLQENEHETKWHECASCEFKSKHKRNLKRHLVSYKLHELQWHECHMCDYKSRWKDRLKAHQSVHKNPSEIQWFQCDKCDYKAKRKDHLQKHTLRHKDASEIKWYKCELCDCKFKIKYALNRHMLIHREGSQIRWHQCEVCDFKSDTKHTFIQHMSFHKSVSDIQWHQCEVCEHKSKTKYDLKQHMLVHKDPSEIQWHQCSVCNYKAKRKSHLQKHMLLHIDTSEIHWYECNMCNYKTKTKYDLSQHMLIHTDASEIQWFECDVCNYKSKHKRVLKKHKLTHIDPSEIKWHECNFCDYKSKYRSSLNRHSHRHHEDSFQLQGNKC